MTGRVAPWDFQPQSDASKEYYRNYGHPDFERALRIPAAGPRTAAEELAGTVAVMPMKAA